MPTTTLVLLLGSVAFSAHLVPRQTRCIPAPRVGQGAHGICCSVSSCKEDIGSLVSYQRNGKTLLGAIVGKKGKTNWDVVSSDNTCLTLKPGDIKYVVPKASSAGAQEAAAHMAAAEDALAGCTPDMLDEVRELLAEDSGTAMVEIAEIARDRTSRSPRL